MLQSLYAQAAHFAPAAGLIVAIIVVGLVASSILRRLVRLFVRKSGLESLAERAGVARALYAVGAREGLASFLGSVTYVAGLVATFTAVSEKLELTVVSSLTTAALRYAPRLVTALAILVGSLLLGSFVQGIVERAAGRRKDVDSPALTAKAARVLVLVIGITLAAEQAGLEVRFVTMLFELLLGMLGLGLALAFALGSYSIVRAMAARHYYKPLVRVGDTITIGADRGTVVRFGQTAIVLRSDDGERIVPCTRLLTHTVVVAIEEKQPNA
jgi:small-conductance mechanosensitive channel